LLLLLLLLFLRQYMSVDVLKKSPSIKSQWQSEQHQPAEG
jgi:hypothetical protein